MKNRVNNIQTAGYNGTCTVDILLGICTTIPQNQFNSDCQIKKRVLQQLNWVTENV